MLAEVVLAPAEAKKVIAKAVVKMEPVSGALKEGRVVMHPSSTTLSIMHELGFSPQGIWVCGAVRDFALCIGRERQEEGKKPGAKVGVGPKNFGHSWVIEKGEWQPQSRGLGSLLEEMGPGDVYIKAGNALDTRGNVGVLYTAPGGGTISLASSEAKKRGFEIVLPIGLEKLIPISVREAAKKAPHKSIDWAMGLPCGLFPIKGTTVTEVDALMFLSGTDVTPIGSGGLDLAHGATVLTIRGSNDNVEKALNIVKEVKGSKSPDLGQVSCNSCPMEKCYLRQG